MFHSQVSPVVVVWSQCQKGSYDYCNDYKRWKHVAGKNCMPFILLSFRHGLTCCRRPTGVLRKALSKRDSLVLLEVSILPCCEQSNQPPLMSLCCAPLHLFFEPIRPEVVKERTEY